MEREVPESTPGLRPGELIERPLELRTLRGERHGPLEGLPRAGPVAQAQPRSRERCPRACPAFVEPHRPGKIGGGATTVPLFDPRPAAKETQRDVRRRP